jgi:hypothetical protein
MGRARVVSWRCRGELPSQRRSIRPSGAPTPDAGDPKKRRSAEPGTAFKVPATGRTKQHLADGISVSYPSTRRATPITQGPCRRPRERRFEPWVRKAATCGQQGE